MNQGRIWCVVNPTVGLPLFLASVAITSLIVHASVMTHTTWMGNYWQGKAAKVAMVDPAADQAKLAVLEKLVAEQKLAMAQAAQTTADAQSIVTAQAAQSVVVASAAQK